MFLQIQKKKDSTSLKLAVYYFNKTLIERLFLKTNAKVRGNTFVCFIFNEFTSRGEYRLSNLLVTKEHTNQELIN